MKNRSKSIVILVILAVMGTLASCEKFHAGGPYNTLEDCIEAKIEMGLDDECNCFLTEDGTWYMEFED